MTTRKQNEKAALGRLVAADANAVSSQFSAEPVLGAELSWNGLRVCSEIHPPPPDRVSDPSVPENCIMLHVANLDILERRLDGGKLMSASTGPGVLTFVPAHQEAEWLWEAEVEILEIYLPPSLLESVAMESGELSVTQSIELRDRFAIRDPFLEQLGFAFKAELERGKSDRLYLESLQTVLAVHLLRHHCSVKISNSALSGGLPKSKLQEIIDYIQDNLDCDIGLAELARVVQVSPHHFGKLFKQSMGVPPHKYVLKCRIEQAKKLLANEQLSLADISQTLGFCDQSHFTNVFRRYTTLTPRQYRNRL